MTLIWTLYFFLFPLKSSFSFFFIPLLFLPFLFHFFFSVCLSIYLSIFLTIYLSIYLLFFLSSLFHFFFPFPFCLSFLILIFPSPHFSFSSFFLSLFLSPHISFSSYSFLLIFFSPQFPSPHFSFSSYFLFKIYGSLTGIKILNLVTNRVVKVLGTVESGERFLSVALYQVRYSIILCVHFTLLSSVNNL